MEKQHLTTDISKRSVTEQPKSLALKIWNIVDLACKEFHVSQATLSVLDSKMVLSYPANADLKSITFECNCNEEDVLNIFSSLAEKSPLEGKIFCRKNKEIQLHFKY